MNNHRLIKALVADLGEGSRAAGLEGKRRDGAWRGGVVVVVGGSFSDVVGGESPRRSEGSESGAWSLMDYEVDAHYSQIGCGWRTRGPHSVVHLFC